MRRANKRQSLKAVHADYTEKIGVATNRKTPRYRSKLETEMQMQMLSLVLNGMDAAEIYSPPKSGTQGPGMGPAWRLEFGSHH